MSPRLCKAHSCRLSVVVRLSKPSSDFINYWIRAVSHALSRSAGSAAQ